jgi:hypothetical protein
MVPLFALRTLSTSRVQNPLITTGYGPATRFTYAVGSGYESVYPFDVDRSIPAARRNQRSPRERRWDVSFVPTAEVTPVVTVVGVTPPNSLQLQNASWGGAEMTGRVGRWVDPHFRKKYCGCVIFFLDISAS